MDSFACVDLNSILALFVLLLGCYLFLRQRKKVPPGPWGLPVLGHAFWFLRHASKHESLGTTFVKASQKYGDLLFFRLGKEHLLILNGYDAIQEVFVTQADHFNDRPQWMIRALFMSQKKWNPGLASECGDNYKKMRKFTLQSLREFGVGKTTMEEKILKEVNAASELLRESVDGEPADVMHIARLLSINVIHGILCGKGFDKDSETVTLLLEYIRVVLERTGMHDFTRKVPNFILKLFGRDKEKEMKRRLDAVDGFKAHIHKVIGEHEESYHTDNIRDFVDLCIQAKQTEEEGHLFTVDNVIQVMFDLFFAGSDTTSNAIIWGIMYMIEYPDVQKRCQQEIREVHGRQVIRWSHRNKLPYVEATLMEIQRMANVAELTMAHTNDEERVVRGYTIPRHTLVMANLMSANKDPRYWDEPEMFNPDRFLEDGMVKKNVAFIPFSTGPRACVGEALAKMELFLVFANFMQRFTFTREHDDVPISFQRDQTQMGAVPVVFKTRIIQNS